MKNRVILHIPHSSPEIPSTEGFVVDHDVLEREIIKLTDWYTDDLFHYEKNDEGEVIRRVTPELKEKVLDEFYLKHHDILSEAVNHQLEHSGRALIIDCHSFPDKPFRRDLDQDHFRPDFNIGTDPFHTPKQLVEIAHTYLEKAGYTVGIDRPYKGSIVPLEHYQKNDKVRSIMLEVNRKLYLTGPGNEKSDGYEAIKSVINGFILAVKDFE